MLRWAVIEAIQRAARGLSDRRQVKDAIIARRGHPGQEHRQGRRRRRLLTLVFYGMRDGQIRCWPGRPETGRMTRPRPAA